MKMEIASNIKGMAFYHDIIFKFYKSYYSDKIKIFNKAYFNGLK